MYYRLLMKMQACGRRRFVAIGVLSTNFGRDEDVAPA